MSDSRFFGRVYSSGVRESSRQRWFDDMELQALAAAPKPQRVVALSEKDREKLVEMATYGKDGQPIGVEGVEVLLPPFFGEYDLNTCDVFQLEGFFSWLTPIDTSC